MSSKNIVLVLACLSALGALTWAISSGRASANPAPLSIPPQESVAKDWWVSVTTPTNPTEEQTKAFMKALVHGTPLPSGYTIVESQGKTELLASGIRNPVQHTWHAIATITEEVGDILEARLFLDGVLKRTATYENGLVEDSGDITIATMPVILPDQGPFSVRLEWDVSGMSTASVRTINF